MINLLAETFFRRLKSGLDYYDLPHCFGEGLVAADDGVLDHLGIIRAAVVQEGLVASRFEKRQYHSTGPKQGLESQPQRRNCDCD